LPARAKAVEYPIECVAASSVGTHVVHVQERSSSSHHARDPSAIAEGQ